jgi:hypothetical protein
VENNRILLTLVKAIVAQVSGKHSVYEITENQRLQDLGIQRQTDIAEFQTRLYRAFSGPTITSFESFVQALAIEPSLTVNEVSQHLSNAVPQLRTRPFSLTGDDPSFPNLVEVVVRAILAQKTRDHSFIEILPEQEIAGYLNPDEADLAEVNTDIYRALASTAKPISLGEFSRTIGITRNSTLRQITHSVMAALPGKDPTDPVG